jgi:uncharacterized membrane protein (TIGR02234 family)
VKRHGAFAVGLLDVVGAGAALLIASRPWQTITVERAAPFPTINREVIGRTVNGAPTAFALVALAGVVAVLATRGAVRRLVGGAIALAGLGLMWSGLASADPIGEVRAHEIAGVPLDATFPGPTVETHVIWPALTAVCGALVAVSGIVIAWRGHRWQAMSARYETPPAQEDADPAKTAATLWTKLDRGEDPTD